MMRYSLVLLAAVAMFNGCGDGSCCDSEPEVTAENPAPVARISGLGSGSSFTCTAGNPLSINGDGSSDDSAIASSSWTVDGQSVDVGNITCPTSGSQEVCLTVVDDQGKSNQACKTVTASVSPSNVAPIARITGLPTGDCTSGDDVNVIGSTSSDGDGSVASYAWTPTSIGTAASGTITCPDANVSQEICLTVTDDDGEDSSQVCSTIKGEVPAAPQLIVPTARITEGDCDAPANNARYFSCETSSDGDAINPNPDIGRTDTSIVRCDWKILVYDAGDNLSADHGNTYTTFFADATVDVPNSTAVSPKWIGHEDGYKIVELNVTDDDGQVSATIRKKFDYTIAPCGGLVDIP